MKSVIIYKSIHKGNTKKIAQAMAEAIDADIFDVNDFDMQNLKNYDLAGFGSGIYFNRHHAEIIEMARLMPISQKTKVFVFSTSGVGTEALNIGLKKIIQDRGFNIIGNWACKGYDSCGVFILSGGINKDNPDNKDLESARQFALEMANKA